jgi:hypothetical protein
MAVLSGKYSIVCYFISSSRRSPNAFRSEGFFWKRYICEKMRTREREREGEGARGIT